MTKKDFELIAFVIQWLPETCEVDNLGIAREFALALKSTNARFDRERFIAAATKPIAKDDNND